MLLAEAPDAVLDALIGFCGAGESGLKGAAPPSEPMGCRPAPVSRLQSAAHRLASTMRP